MPKIAWWKRKMVWEAQLTVVAHFRFGARPIFRGYVSFREGTLQLIHWQLAGWCCCQLRDVAGIPGFWGPLGMIVKHWFIFGIHKYCICLRSNKISLKWIYGIFASGSFWSPSSLSPVLLVLVVFLVLVVLTPRFDISQDDVIQGHSFTTSLCFLDILWYYCILLVLLSLPLLLLLLLLFL